MCSGIYPCLVYSSSESERMAHNFFVFLWYLSSLVLFGSSFLGSSLYRFVRFFILSKSQLIFCTFFVVCFISDLTFILSIICMYLFHRLGITSDALLLVSMFSFCLQGHLRVSCFPCIVSVLNLQFHSVVTCFVRDRVSPT